MLKKHIRTHTDVRPYTCKHCTFSFKTKGNLTKHMKSKAHYKRCMEMNISPIPTTVEAENINEELLAQQQALRQDGNEESENEEEEEEDESDGGDDEETTTGMSEVTSSYYEIVQMAGRLTLQFFQKIRNLWKERQLAAYCHCRKRLRGALNTSRST